MKYLANFTKYYNPKELGLDEQGRLHCLRCGRFLKKCSETRYFCTTCQNEVRVSSLLDTIVYDEKRGVWYDKPRKK